MSAARLLHLWCLPDAQRDVAGPNDSGSAAHQFFEQNTYRLRLHALAQNDDPGSLTRFLPSSFSGFTTFEAALGLLDAKPDSGKWRMRVTGTGPQTAALAFDIAPADLATALNALAAVTHPVEVTAGNAGNIYIIRPTVPADDFTFEVSEIDLTPLCIQRVRKGTDGAGSYTMVKLVKAYLAFADTWTFPTPPPATIAMGRIGDVTKNCIQYLAIPFAAAGSFSFTHAGIETTLIAVDTDASTIAAALNALFVDGASSPRFRVLKSSSAFQIECLGPLAKQAVALLGLTLFGQEPLDTPEADFQLTELPLEMTVAGKDGVNLVFELTGIDAANNEWTLIRDTRATVLNTLIDRTTSAAIGAIATHYDTVYLSAEPTEALIIGQRSAAVIVTGSGTVGSAGEYSTAFTHNLNTLTPGVCIFELVNVAPAKWRLVPETEYDARSDGDPNVIIVVFPFTPPTTGHAGSLKIFCTNFDAQVWTNVHTHPLTAIHRASDMVTLDVILATLTASLPTGWPVIPGSQIADGSITPDKLDLDALAAALGRNAKFLQTLVTLMSDSNVLNAIAAGLLASANFLTSLANSSAFLTALTSNAAFVAALLSNVTFLEAVRGVVLDMLTGAASRDSILIRLPDTDATFPALPAGGALPPLAAIQISPASLGSVTGSVPKAAGGNAGQTFTVAGGAHLQPHRRKLFADGDVIFSDGYDWFRAAVDGAEYSDAAMDRQLFALHVNDAMLAPGTKLALNFGFTLALAGANCEGYYLFELKRGTANSAGTPQNLSTVTWDETVISQPLILTDSAVTHSFAYTAARTAGGVLTATKAAYLAPSSAAAAPAAARFVLLAQLTHFDVQNVPDPRGQVRLAMKSATATIVKL